MTGRLENVVIYHVQLSYKNVASLDFADVDEYLTANIGAPTTIIKIHLQFQQSAEWLEQYVLYLQEPIGQFFETLIYSSLPNQAWN